MSVGPDWTVVCYGVHSPPVIVQRERTHVTDCEDQSHTVLECPYALGDPRKPTDALSMLIAVTRPPLARTARRLLLWARKDH